MDKGVEVVNEIVVVVFEHMSIEETNFGFKIWQVADFFIEGFLAEEFLLLIVIFHDFHDILFNMLFLSLEDLN